jgi:hypothetical protein
MKKLSTLNSAIRAGILAGLEKEVDDIVLALDLVSRINFSVPTMVGLAYKNDDAAGLASWRLTPGWNGSGDITLGWVAGKSPKPSAHRQDADITLQGLTVDGNSTRCEKQGLTWGRAIARFVLGSAQYAALCSGDEEETPAAEPPGALELLVEGA